MVKKITPEKNIQGLIIFKHKKSSRKKKTNKYLLEKKSREDKITIINSLTNQGIYYRYSILLNNNSSVAITDISITILYPKILKLTRSYPPTLKCSFSVEEDQDEVSNINIHLKGLKNRSSEQFYLHFTSSAKLGGGELITLFKYVNNEGKKREIKSQSIRIQIYDLKIKPKIISHSMVREFSQIPGMKRTLISLGIGTNKQLNLKKIFDILEKLIISFNFQLITKDKEKGILWFFGSELKSNNDLLALIKIGPNIIEIIAYSINPIILYRFITLFYKDLKDRLLENKIIKPNLKIFELLCINCGENLPYFPKKGELITCIKCSNKQLVW
ncbi:MAG: hypothetical protein ACFFA0_01710 [Promethearchaeota archaeon]